MATPYTFSELIALLTWLEAHGPALADFIGSLDPIGPSVYRTRDLGAGADFIATRAKLVDARLLARELRILLSECREVARAHHHPTLRAWLVEYRLHQGEPCATTKPT